MKYRFAPLALCAFVAASTSLAQSTVTVRTLPTSAGIAAKTPHAVGPRARSRATATTCAGADTTGPSSFNGVPNVGNTAGGVALNPGFAPSAYVGVVAGCNNIAGDFYTGILAGAGNSIQPGASDPDSYSYDAVIVGGAQNAIGGSPSSIIGAGSNNAIGGASSVIAAGDNNTVRNPVDYGGQLDSGVVAGSEICWSPRNRSSGRGRTIPSSGTAMDRTFCRPSSSAVITIE